jgi:phosphinothricin acetyltransferase
VTGGPIRVVDAAASHLEAIAAIYGEAVEHTAATFDLEVPGRSYWEHVLGACDEAGGRFLLVALAEDDTVLGYAKTGQFRDKGAYATTAETSVYVAEAARTRGVGSLLYSALIERAEASPLHRLVAGLTMPNEASVALHAAHGFRPVGTFSEVGIKFGRPWDVTWFERAV